MVRIPVRVPAIQTVATLHDDSPGSADKERECAEKKMLTAGMGKI